MRGARSLTAIPASDGGSAIARLAARGAAARTVPINAKRLMLAPAHSSSATSQRPRRALVHKSSGAPASPAVLLRANIVGVMNHPLSPPAVGSHVSSRRALATDPLAPSHQPFMPLSPCAPQPSSAAAQTSLPLRSPHQGLPRQTFFCAQQF